jgi:hypothetical protein
MLDIPVNQAAGLMGLGSHAGSQMIAMVCHGDEKAELPLLWRLCGALSELGYPVAVLDASKTESDENPGLDQLLDYRFSHGMAEQDVSDWAVIPAARGLHNLCTMQSNKAQSLRRLGQLFQPNCVVILYASADLQVQLLGDSQTQPLLAVSASKSALLTSYLALKRLLINGRLTPTILNMMQGQRSHGTETVSTVATHLSECAKNFLGYHVNAMQIDLSSGEKDLAGQMRHLATNLMESAAQLRPGIAIDPRYGESANLYAGGH